MATKKYNPATKRPCMGCPFVNRPGRVVLAEGRASEIMRTADPFVCHETAPSLHGDARSPRTCAGWVVMRHRAGMPTSQAVRIFQRLGAFDVEALDRDCEGLPVFDSLAAMERAAGA